MNRNGSIVISGIHRVRALARLWLIMGAWGVSALFSACSTTGGSPCPAPQEGEAPVAATASETADTILISWEWRSTPRPDILEAHEIDLVLHHLDDGRRTVTLVATVSGRPFLRSAQSPGPLAIGEGITIEAFYGGLSRRFEARLEQGAVTVYEHFQDEMPPDLAGEDPGAVSGGTEVVLSIALPPDAPGRP